MELTWFGTAGFEIKTGDHIFLIDPYLSRNPEACPTQTLTPCDIETASRIFLSHGHFDHIRDVPQIALQTQARIYCSNTAADFLIHRDVNKKQIVPILDDKKTFTFQNYSAQACFSKHIKFDARLVLSTLLKMNRHFFKYLPLFRNFPCGRVLSWRFYIENKVIQFFGSAGSSSEELKTIGDTPIDILLLPMQGHSDICRIGLGYVKLLKPKIVIPHHHDNFFPPVSKAIDLRPFAAAITHSCPQTRVIVPKMNETLIF